jgi:hypothetical protein
MSVCVAATILPAVTIRAILAAYALAYARIDEREHDARSRGRTYRRKNLGGQNARLEWVIRLSARFALTLRTMEDIPMFYTRARA